MKRKHATNRDRDIKVIGLRVRGEEYGLPLSQIKEVIAAPRITRVPGAAGHIRGVVNLRGAVIPVLDLATMLGLGKTTVGEQARIVALEHDNELLGLLAESVGRITKIADSDVKPPPQQLSGVSAEYVTGVAKSANRFLIFLDMDRLLAADAAMEKDEADV